MVQYKTTFLIGSNNTTHKVELSKTLKVLNKYFEGYTITKTLGYWMGKKENSIKVEVLTDYRHDYKKVTLELKDVLKQQAILAIPEVIEAHFI